MYQIFYKHQQKDESLISSIQGGKRYTEKNRSWRKESSKFTKTWISNANEQSCFVNE